ncbi:MAG: cob(I)yrinic acid a,c-diamide adenosyltransferase [Ghiorsea sp.]
MKKRERRQGVMVVNTGEGKGKSSSAFGMVFRAAGWGMKVLVIQFIKGKWKTGEQKASEKFDNIEWHVMGDGFTWDTKNPEQDIKTTREIWNFAKEKIQSEEFDFVLLDEINYCTGYGWLSGEEVVGFLEEYRPNWMHMVFTGRNADEKVVEYADTVTNMTNVKHAFDKDIQATQGIEF